LTKELEKDDWKYQKNPNVDHTTGKPNLLWGIEKGRTIESDKQCLIDRCDISLKEAGNDCRDISKLVQRKE
jgi:hypothetical protein